MSLSSLDRSWWSVVYRNRLSAAERRDAVSELASAARDPAVQSRLIAAGVHVDVLAALVDAGVASSHLTTDSAGATAALWAVQAQVARLVANLAYQQENKGAVFEAGASEALEAAARAVLPSYERHAAARRALGSSAVGAGTSSYCPAASAATAAACTGGPPPSAASGEEATAAVLLETAAALANLASGPQLRSRCLEPASSVLTLLFQLARLRADIAGEAVRALSNLACSSATHTRLLELRLPQARPPLLPHTWVGGGKEQRVIQGRDGRVSALEVAALRPTPPP